MMTWLGAATVESVVNMWIDFSRPRPTNLIGKYSTLVKWEIFSNPLDTGNTGQRIDLDHTDPKYILWISFPRSSSTDFLHLIDEFDPDEKFRNEHTSFFLFFDIKSTYGLCLMERKMRAYDNIRDSSITKN